MKAAVEFEQLRTLMMHDASASKPDSASLQYEKRLEALRQTLREQRHEYPLGAILVSIGVLTDGQLNHALFVQRQSKPERLLGELLVEMELVEQNELTHALSIQNSTPSFENPSNTNPFGGVL